MPVRRAAFGPLAAVSCCVLSSLGPLADASSPDPPRTHHKSPTLHPTVSEVPFFQPGYWEYRRTVMKEDSTVPEISVLRKCADPSTEIRLKMSQLGRKGCSFGALTRRRGRYFTSWTCPTALGPTRFRAVLIVRGAAGYTDLSEMRAAARVARQRIDAAWIGECPEKPPDASLR